MAESKRKGNKPWKHVYGKDRKYTARVDRLAERRGWPGREQLENMSTSELNSFLASRGVEVRVVEP
jgi:hypothetical protein